MTTPADLARFNAGVARARADYHARTDDATTRRRVGPDERAEAVRAYLAGEEDRDTIAGRLDVHPDTLTNWARASKRGAA